jgi:hypothetical protein
MRHFFKLAVLGAAVCTLSTAALAYVDTDKANVVLKLGSRWEVVGKQTDSHDTLVAYFNSTTGSKGETILQTASVKTLTSSAESQVMKLFIDMKSGITQRGCSVADLQEVTATDGMFHEWRTGFQCKMPAQTGVMVIADADPYNIYTFTYNSKTDADNGTGAQVIRDNIQLCYKNKSCYPL